jgi:hypothetical protein
LVGAGILLFTKKRWAGIVPIVVGCGLITLSVFGPLSNSRKKIDQLRNIDSILVKQITIQPTTTDKKSLVPRDITITDRGIINKFCHALSQTTVVTSQYLKSPDSVCRLRFDMDNGKNIVVGIRIKGRAASVEVNSSGESGWHYGKLKAEELGRVMRESL